jgi:hypothetical protein
MSALGYLLRRMLANTIKGIFKKPIVLIGYIVAAAFVVLMIVASFMMPSGNLNQGSAELFRAVTTAVFAIILYFSFRMGVDKGSTYFRMSDVNMLFPSPLRPNQIMIYGFVRQIGGTLLLMMIALFQVPNLKNQFVMQSYGPLIILLSVVMYMMAYPVFAMLIYSWTSKTKQRRKIGKRALDGLALLVGLLFLLSLAQTRKLDAALIGLFDHAAMNWVPVLGWIRMVLNAAVDGVGPLFWLGIGLTLVTVIVFTVWVYRVNLDYYEDVLEATEFTEAAYAAKREGRNMQFNQKVRSGVRQGITGGGGKAIFSRSILEKRKTSLLLFFDKTSLIIVIASIAFKLFMPDEAGPGFSSLFSILAFSVYMLFLFSVQGLWAGELEKPYLYLIPATAAEKLFYVTLADNIKNLLDGVLLFVIAGVLFKENPLMIVLCTLSYACFGAVFLYGDILARRVFGGVLSKSLLMFIELFFVLLILIPGIVAAVVLMIAFESPLLMAVGFGGWALFAAFLLFTLSLGALDNLEMAG